MRNLLLLVAVCTLSPGIMAECTIDESDDTVCEAETVVESDAEIAEFQPPSINGNDQVGVIALSDPASFLYRGLIYPTDGDPIDALLRTDSNEGSFFNIRVSTLDRFPTLALSDAAEMFGPVDVFDEFGGGILALGRGGSGGFSIIPDPDTFDAGTFVNVDATTPFVVSPTGTYAFTAEVRANSGATLVGEAIFRGFSTTDVVVQSGLAAPDAGETYQGFFTPVQADTLAINSLQQLAFTALVSGAGIDASSDERLIRETDSGFVTIAREGDSAPETDGALGAIYANNSNHTFGNISYSSRGDTVFSARLQPTSEPLPYLTGGADGAGDYDGIFALTPAGSERGIVAKGDTAGLYFDAARLADDGSGNAHVITGLGTPQLNNQGQVAFFAHAGQSPRSRNSLALFTYDIDADGFVRVFQTSGQTLEEIVSSADRVDGLSFFAGGNYQNQLAINDMGAVAFTAQVIAGVSAPTQEGLFLYNNGQLDTLALAGASIQTDSGLKTISRIEFLSGSTSSGRPTGLSNNTVAAFGLIFDDATSGVFTSRQQVFVVEDFLWSGSCGSSNWHDGCASTNWLDRLSGEDANRLPGSETMDRVFIDGADVVIDAQPVDIFSILASGSLDVRQALTLGGPSEIENLMLAADLSMADELILRGANGVWLAGSINGDGELLLSGTATETARLVADLAGTALLNVPVTVGAAGEFSVDGGEVLIGDNGFITVAADGALGFTSGLLSRSPTHAGPFVVENAGSLFKAGPGSAEIAAHYRQSGGTALVSGGTLSFSGIADLTGRFTVEQGATLAFGNPETAVFWRGIELNGGGTIAVTSTVAIAGTATAAFEQDGVLELDADGELIGGGLHLTGGTLRKIGDGDGWVSELNAHSASVDVTAGGLTLGGGEFNEAEITVADAATLVLAESDIQISADSTVTGAGMLTLTDSVRIVSLGEEETDLALDVTSSVDGAVFEGRVLGTLLPLGSRSSLQVVNTGDMTVADLTLDGAELRNGLPPRILADELGDPGNFNLPVGSTLRVAQSSTFSNSVDSTAELRGFYASARDDGNPIPHMVILNSGIMTLDLEPMFPSVPDSRIASNSLIAYNNVGGVLHIGASDRAEAFTYWNLGRLVLDEPYTTTLPLDVALSIRNDAGGTTDISTLIRGLLIQNSGRLRLLEGAVVEDSLLNNTIADAAERDAAAIEVLGSTLFSDVVLSGEMDLRIGANTEIRSSDLRLEGTVTINADLSLLDRSRFTPDHVVMMSGSRFSQSEVDGRYLDAASSQLLRGDWVLDNAQASVPGFSMAGIGEDARVTLSGESTRFFGLLGERPDPLVNRGTLSLQDMIRTVGLADTPDAVVNHGSLVLNQGSVLRALGLLNQGFLRLNGGMLQLTSELDNVGTLDIGASPGTGTIDGDLVHAGVLAIELGGTRPGLDYDQLIVTGTTTIAPGGAIEITLIDPDPDDGVDELFRPRTGDAFEFLRTGTLDLGNADLGELIRFTNAPSGLRFNVDLLDANGMFSLLLNAQFGIDNEVLSALSGNRAEMGFYLNTLLLGNQLDEDDRLAPISDLAALSAAAFSAAADQLHPEMFSGAPEMLGYQQSFALKRLFTAEMNARAGSDRGLWLGVLDGSSTLDGSDGRGTKDVDGDVSGAVFGGDLPLGESARTFVGAFIGQTSGDQSLTDVAARQDYDGLVFGVYGGYRGDDVDLQGYVSHTSGEVDSLRSQSVGGVTARLVGDYDVDMWQGYLGASLPAVWQNKHLHLRPVAGLSYVQIEREGFSEQGGTFALDVLGDQYEGLFSELGLSLTGGEADWQPRLQLGWRYNLDYNTDRARARLAGTRGPLVSVRGARTPRSMAYLGLGLTTRIGSGRFFIEYQGDYAHGLTAHTGNLGVYFPL